MPTATSIAAHWASMRSVIWSLAGICDGVLPRRVDAATRGDLVHVAGADSGGTAAVTRTLVRAYACLGGVDANGHGDAQSPMVVWARIALVIYALDALWRWLFGLRAPPG
jgi:hypothetical protein